MAMKRDDELMEEDPRPGSEALRNRTLRNVLIVVAILVGVLIGGLWLWSLNGAVVDGEGNGPGDSQVATVATPTPTPTSALLVVVDPTPVLTPAPKPTPVPTPTPESTPTPTLVPTPTPVPTSTPEPTPVLRIMPEVDFGEGFDVLDDGQVRIRYPDGSVVDTWFTIQVNTTEISRTGLFFASFDESNNLINTVKVERYERGSEPDNAEVTLYFSDAPKRIIKISVEKITVNQEYNLKPYGPSLFSPKTRLNLLLQNFKFEGGLRRITVNQNIDVSGLVGGEDRYFEILLPSEAARMLEDIDFLIRQIEENRRK